MRHPNKQNNGAPVIGTRARKKATRNAAFLWRRERLRRGHAQDCAILDALPPVCTCGLDAEAKETA